MSQKSTKSSKSARGQVKVPPGQIQVPGQVQVAPGQPYSQASAAAKLPMELRGSGEPEGFCDCCMIFLAYMAIVFTFPFSICFCIKFIQEYERAVVFRLGRIAGGPRGPGIVCINPIIDALCKVDLRTITFDVPPQEILSKDSVTVTVDAVLYFRIFDAVSAVVNVVDVYYSTKLLCQTMLRNTLGMKTLSEMLSDRSAVTQHLQIYLDKATDPWGVKVERIEIKDIRLPLELQRAMAAEAEATRDAKAKVIAAEGEYKASNSLKVAAETMAGSSGAFQLRYLQTLCTIAQERKSTIIFPLPMETIFTLNPTSSSR